MLEQLRAPVETLGREYLALADEIRAMGEGLADLFLQGNVAMTDADDRVRQFHDQLAALPGVTNVHAVQDEGQVVLHVELAEPEEPTVICVQCGRTITPGGATRSHGLCPECAEDFIQDAKR